MRVWEPRWSNWTVTQHTYGQNYVKTVKKLFYSSREVRYLKEAVESVQTVVVESGATCNKGRGGNCEPASPISLHTVPWERSKKQLADTLLLKKGSQGGRTSLGFTLVYWFSQEPRHTHTGKEPKKESEEEHASKAKQSWLRWLRWLRLQTVLICPPAYASLSQFHTHLTMLPLLLMSVPLTLVRDCQGYTGGRLTKKWLKFQGLYSTVAVEDFAGWDRRAQLISSCQPVGCDSTPQNWN
jgi:hypothetical protein